MLDLKLAAQGAIYRALNGSAAVSGLSSVYQHVPDEADPPLTVIDKMTATPAGGKGDQFDLIEFEITSLVREPGRKHLTPLMTAIREALEGRPLLAPGVGLSPPVFESDDDGLLDDGNTYFGVQRFTLFAQPAN